MFAGRDGRPLTSRNVELRIKHYAKAAGITRSITPHTLRHSIAVHYLQGGAPVNFVQSLLGHSSLATTGRYLQLADQMAKQFALQTRTALDGEPRARVERKAREGKKAYEPDEALRRDLFVSCVLEWLAGDQSISAFSAKTANGQGVSAHSGFYRPITAAQSIPICGGAGTGLGPFGWKIVMSPTPVKMTSAPTKVDAVKRSPATAQPRNTATTGLIKA